LLPLHRSGEYDGRLKRFVTDPGRFRGWMRRHGAVISGPFALQFVLGEEWKDDDSAMELYVSAEAPVDAFLDWMLACEGYRVDRVRHRIGGGDRLSMFEGVEGDDEEEEEQDDWVDGEVCGVVEVSGCA
jgi:hypothetical protein